MAKKLTVKQETFCNKYLECGNASEAYRYAYNCAKSDNSTIWENACRLLADSNVKARLAYLKAHLAEAAGISALRIVREHEKIAFMDATRLRKGWMALKDFEALTPDERACIKNIETKQTKRVDSEGETIVDEWVKITCYDKQKSLDSLRTMLGYDAPTKIEVEQTISSTDAHRVIFENYEAPQND